MDVPRQTRAQEASILNSLSKSTCSSLTHVRALSTGARLFRKLPTMLPALALMSSLGCGDDAVTDDMTNPEDPLIQNASADGGVGGDARVGSHTGKPDASGGGSSCGALNINAMPNAPEVLIVLDRSGSMIGNSAAKTKRWEPSAKVIKKITAQLDQQMKFGLMVFPEPVADVVNVCAPGKVGVSTGLGNGAKIASMIDASPPTWDSATPTAAALETALQTIGAASTCSDCVPAKKYVLLVTDGAPNCGSDNHTSTRDSDVTECNGKLDELTSDGVTTYVIGYDTAKDTKLAGIMDGFAMHGGTGKQLPVEDEASLLATLTQVAGQLVACDYKLASEVEDPSYVRVTLDGQQVDFGTGWSLKEDKRTIVLGSACEKLRDAKPHNLGITLECSQVIAI